MPKDPPEVQLAVIQADITYMKQDLHDIKNNITKHCITRAEHELFMLRITRMEKIVYGFVGLILVAVVMALIKLVLQ